MPEPVSRQVARLPGRVFNFALDSSRRIWHSPIFFIALAGVLVRIALIPYSFDGDLTTFAGTSISLNYGGGPYGFINIYPPLWDFTLALAGRLATFLFPGSQLVYAGGLSTLNFGFNIEPSLVTTPLFSVIEKSFILPFDLGTGLLLYTISKTVRTQFIGPRTVFALWFLNPLVISQSAIHGDFDVIPTFFIILCFYLILESSELFAGLSLGIGIGLKLFPVFLVPLALAVIWKQRTSHGSGVTRALCLFLAGLGAVTVLTFWPPGVLSDYVLYSTTGSGVGLDFTGFWFWSVASLPGFSWLSAWSFQNSAAIILGSTILAVVIAVAVGLRVALSKERFDGWSSLVGPIIISIGAVYIDTHVLQAQYLVWILPVLILGLSMDRRYVWSVLVVSVLPTLYYLAGLQGPWYLFQNLAVYTHVVSVGTVQGSMQWFARYTPLIETLTFVPTFVFLIDALFSSLYAHPVRGGEREAKVAASG